MLKKLLGVCLIVGSSVGYASASEQCEFSPEQQKVLQFAYNKGKERGFGWTLTAIAWQESSAGLKLKNKSSDSYGIFGNMLSTVESRLKDKEFSNTLPAVPLNRRQTINLLKNDWDFAAEMSLVELEYWAGRHKGNHNKTIASYFAGNKHKLPAAKGYASRLNDKIRFLKSSGCIHE